MKWFGETWGAPVCSQGDQVEAPVGVLCAHCDEPIEAGDQGVLIDGAYGYDVEDVVEKVHRLESHPWHIDCFIRSVVGSVGHQRKRCHCYGGNEEDPPGMSKREAATAAVALFRQKHPGG